MGCCLSTARERRTQFSKHYQPLSQIHVNPRKSEPSLPHNRFLPATWLDQLPTKICSRIAHFISNGRPCLDALRLAETSHRQSAAVLEALTFKFTNECLENELEARWAAIFMDRVQEIEITSGFYEGCVPLLKLLRAPTLRKVTIFAEDGVMRTLAESASVKELTLSVTRDTAFETLNEMLYRLNLHHISLVCMSFYDEDDCAFFPFKDHGYLADFADACKRLSYLVVDCDHEISEHPMWYLLKAAPSVDRTTINVDPPTELLPRLRGFKSVEIGCNVSDWRLLAEQLGPAVTLLETYCTADDASVAKDEIDFVILTNCPNMCDLEICIKTGVEEWLLRTLRSFTSLRRLAIRWVSTVTEQNKAGDRNPLYYAPDRGVITSMVKACPNVEKLCLRCVRLSTQEQDEVLGILGNRLLEVEVSFNGQQEHTFDRIEALLRSAIRHNHKLHKIELVEEECDVRVWDGEEEENRTAIEEQRGRLLGLLSVLRRWAPKLDDSDLRDYITEAEAPRKEGGIAVQQENDDEAETVSESPQ